MKIVKKDVVVPIVKFKYKTGVCTRIYRNQLYTCIDMIMEGSYARGYNACLDDVREYLPKNAIGRRPKSLDYD